MLFRSNMATELTITNIYTDIADCNTYDSLIHNLKQTTMMSTQSNLLQCVVCYRLREHIETTTKKGSAERKEKLLQGVKVLGENAKKSLFDKYAVIGSKVETAIKNGIAPEIALNKSMKNYITVDVKKQANPKPKKTLDDQVKQLQDKIEELEDEVDHLTHWKKQILQAIKDQDLDTIKQLIKK